MLPALAATHGSCSVEFPFLLHYSSSPTLTASSVCCSQPKNYMLSHRLLKHAKSTQHKCQTHSFIIKLHKQAPNSKKTKRTICKIFVQTSYHMKTWWMVMNWVSVHDRVKYLSLLHTKFVLWAYTASYKWVGGADSLRWMLDTHMHLVLMITLLFHACFLVLEIPLLLTTTHSTTGNAILCNCFPFKYRLHPSLAWHNT